jgi:hypothetical protein
MAQILLREVDCAERPAGRAVLHSPFGTISVNVNSGEALEPGLIAGSEGLGSEFFLDKENCIRGMDLDLRPRKVISIPPLEEIRSVRDTMRAGARPARAAIEHPSKHAINPDAIWISPSLDVAIFAFGGARRRTLRASIGDRSGLKFLEISSVVVIGMDSADRSLRLVLVESFGEERMLFNETVSVQTRGENFVHVLDAIQRQYFESGDPKEFVSARKRLITGLGPAECRDLEKLADIYQLDLEVGARLAPARRPG